MIKLYLQGLLFILCFSPAIGQNTMAIAGAESSVDTTRELVTWIADIYTFGVITDGDSLIVSDEVQSLLFNPELRKKMYPEVYGWEKTKRLLEKMELKKAFWYFINLYEDPANQEMVMKMIIKYDDLFEMDVALLSAYYTYGMLDPEVANVSAKGEVEITRPDLIEAKLIRVQGMINYLKYYRSLSANDQKP